MTPDEIKQHKALLQDVANKALEIATTESFREMSNMWGYLEEAYVMIDDHASGEISGRIKPDDEDARAIYLDNLISLAGMAIALAADAKESPNANR